MSIEYYTDLNPEKGKKGRRENRYRIQDTRGYFPDSEPLAPVVLCQTLLYPATKNFPKLSANPLYPVSCIKNPFEVVGWRHYLPYPTCTLYPVSCIPIPVSCTAIQP